MSSAHHARSTASERVESLAEQAESAESAEQAGAGLPERAGTGSRRRARAHEPVDSDATAELTAVLEAVDAGIITLDENGRVRSQNDAAEAILGRRLHDVTELLGPWGGNGPAADGPTSRETTELHLLARPDRWLALTRHARGAGGVGEIIVLRDVTASRQSRGLRDAFLGMLSHELRTPVTSIYAATQLLRSDSASLDPTERRGLVDDINEESERLLRLVDDLLVLSHFDEGIELVQEPSLLQHVVPPVVEQQRRRWPDVEIELDVGAGLPVVTGDETSVQQVVRNLVSNAIKYGLGEPVLVQISGAGEPGAVVRVLDRGAGVSPEEAESLFRPFFRSTRTARASSGAGVGLYVCRRLVEAMGGHMWARRRDGGGSEFGFWLPEYAYEPDDGLERASEPLQGPSSSTIPPRPSRR